MDDLFEEENLPPGEPEPPPEVQPSEQHTGPTGPRTPEGKAISSENRIVHGCRSEKTVLRSEDPAEFESCVNGWFEYYKPESSVAVILVQETARAHWQFKRASKCFEDVAWRLPGDAWCWTDENHRIFSNFSRYKTAAERTFNRFFKQAESHFDKLFHNDELQERGREARARIEMKWLSEKEKSAPKELIAEQIVEVEVVDGNCKTSCHPPTDWLIGKMAEKATPPVFINRSIRFPQGVPPEYAWTHPNHLQEFTNTECVQKMSYKFWLEEVVEREKAAGTGHIGPSNYLAESRA